MRVEVGHTDRGKWSQPGVPHRGWTCADVEDLGQPSMVCEMCESVDIRYVHHMQHPDYPDMIGVGCVCAERLEDDYVRPRVRENSLKSAARRRASWARRTWNLSQRGNWYINTEGYNITIVPQGRGLAVLVTNRQTGASRRGRIHDNVEIAKMRGLDALLWAKDHLS